MIDFFSEEPAKNRALIEVWDVPSMFSRSGRRYGLRAVYRQRALLPAALASWHSRGEYRRALAEYARRPA
jgi:hypothetical protein